MKIVLFYLLIPLFLLQINCSSKMKTVQKKNLLIITGKKSHPAALHEYHKQAKLIKTMLDKAENVKGINASFYLDEWPDSVDFAMADLILVISDGRDGPQGSEVPMMVSEERMNIVQKQVERGCGLMTFHFSTFADDADGERMLDWVGGYFDWQNEQGGREWYSAIQYRDTMVNLTNPDHPVCNGIKPFQLFEEFYYHIRFRDADKRWTPILDVPSLSGERTNGGVVAWAVEREDGGRGFGTTLGHFYGNWKNDNYRKLLLNAIVWSAGMEVPEEGVESNFFTAREVNKHLYGSEYNGLILSGNNHPAHHWEETSVYIQKMLNKDSLLHADLTDDLESLFGYDLRDYDFLLFDYCNWEDPKALDQKLKNTLINYVGSGGGLMFVHFSNGAFHFSLPNAGESDWPEYRILCRRVWDHTDSVSGHDKYGEFIVENTGKDHEITRGIDSFNISDELYFKQQGDADIEVLMTAHSKVTGKDEPMVFVYELQNENGSKSRVFQTVLGHDTVSLSVPELQKIFQRAAVWTSRNTVLWKEL